MRSPARLGFLLVAVVVAVVTAPLGAPAADAPVVATVKAASGAAWIVRQGQPLPAQLGQYLGEADVLRTGTDGSLAVILRDDSVLTLGPDTEIAIERFVFEPAERRLGLVLRMARGLATYISGKIAKLAPGLVQFETPVASVGVRGTYLAARVDPAEP